ncbi:hypothetical protein [Sphingomonas nostoxanthinifaciens]|uniref:hypothetical protein n=1 Tax=Sphingomonas nostoxanthinifaciens TaxID=2872652 RepID=UPI001CC1D4F0|nr:hypothetical protein [Sphingomonas nostoxanthinifaciens]UAK26313.1 hypothetical protein K8P63_09610 [Sphingomonas nostoxanthinifaciens]
MRYFLDTEFNGFGGALLSLALVPEDGGDDFYVVLPLEEPAHPWVGRHVLPYLKSVPPMLYNQLDRVAAGHDVAAYLRTDPDPEIVADWPEDIALFCRLLLTAETEIVDVASLRFRFMRTPGFSTARNSQVPHNALHDARALRDHVLGAEQ